MFTPIQRIRRAAIAEEIDYNLLMSCLEEYSSPRDVVTRMLRNKELIRVKKGLYVFGNDYAKRPYSLELLGNMIYGPSYVSCEYALSFYGLIPEAVHEVTSITIGRNKTFNTPVGRFTYKHLHLSKYHIGIDRIKIDEEFSAAMATPEKALADTVFKRGEKAVNIDEMRKILLEDYRIDSSDLGKLDMKLMKQIAEAYQNTSITLLTNIIRNIKENE